VSGYSREEHTHLAVAAAVAKEPYDLVLRASTLADALLAPLWTLLDRPDFRAGVEALGGYSCAETGRRIR